MWPEPLRSLVQALGAHRVNEIGLRRLGYPAVLATAEYEFRAILEEASRTQKVTHELPR